MNIYHEKSNGKTVCGSMCFFRRYMGGARRGCVIAYGSRGTGDLVPGPDCPANVKGGRYGFTYIAEAPE